MRKLWLVIRREYRLRVRTRTFILSTVGLPALMICAFVIPTYFASRHVGHTLRIAIVDQVGGLGRSMASRLQMQKLPNGKPQFDIVDVLERPAENGSAMRQLRDKVRAGSLSGYLLLPSNLLKNGSAEFYTHNPGDFTLISTLESAITRVAVGGRLAADKVHISDIDALLARAKVGVVQINDKGEKREKGQTFTAAILLAIILYTSLLMYGITTMRSIQEEKSTRIMEILLSSVRPFQLLAGKILGVGAVGFTQYLIWALAGAAVVGYGAQMFSVFSATGFHVQIPFALWFWFVIYFLAGYFLYSSLFAAVGAAVSSEQDANQAQMPISMLLIAGFVMFPIVARSPSSTIAVALTMVPFFSPVLMVLRIALGSPPLWQILLSVGILVATTLGMVYISAKIYRVGVLMYGKRPSVVEVLRWLRYT
jgi:ABC-2 type transport system permease protein